MNIALKLSFIAAFLVLAACLMSACASPYKVLARFNSIIPFNYSGIRFESRGAQPEAGNHLIICFGDSSTFGWNMAYADAYPYLLEDKITKEGYCVINMGSGGNTIIDAYHRMQKDVIRYEPDIVCIHFGLNDAMLHPASVHDMERSGTVSIHGSNYAPQVSLEAFEKHYHKIIDALQKNQAEVLVLGTNPVTEGYPRVKDILFQEKQRELFALYDAKIKEVADEKAVTYIDVRDYFESLDAWEDYMHEDGLHINERGSALIAEMLFDALTKMSFAKDPS